MHEEQNNTSDTDISGIFSTYKTNSYESEGGVSIWNIHENKEVLSPLWVKNNPLKNDRNNVLKGLQIVIDGCVRITKVAVWSIAVLGWLFITALATNTIDRAISIINTNIGTNISVSGEVGITQSSPEQKKVIPWLTSSAITNATPSNIPESIATKRRAILEARKAAKLLEANQTSLEKTVQ